MKELLEHRLYDEELDLDQLIKLRKDMENYDFSKPDFEYVNELIYEKIDIIDDIEKIEELRSEYSSYGFDVILFDKAIRMRNLLKEKKIEDMTKEELDFIVENENLELEDLVKIVTTMKKYDYDDDDYEYVNDLITEEIDVLDDPVKVKELRDKYLSCGYDVSMFNKVINMNNLLNDKKIESMSEEELLYLFNHEKLSIVNLFRVYTTMKNNNVDEFYREDVEDSIKENINDLIYEMDDVEDILLELKNTDFKCSKYNCDTLILKNYINPLQIEVNKAEKERKKLRKAVILGTLFGAVSGFKKGLLDYHPNDNDYLMDWERDLVNSGEYTEDQFEEEEMDEDDYYYEDID